MNYKARQIFRNWDVKEDLEVTSFKDHVWFLVRDRFEIASVNLTYHQVRELVQFLQAVLAVEKGT